MTTTEIFESTILNKNINTSDDKRNADDSRSSIASVSKEES